MNERTFADGLFFGYVHFDTAPALQLDARVSWQERAADLPKRFLAPLSGPDGMPVGFIEFAFHTTARRLGRWVAVALHPETPETAFAKEFFSDLPVVHVLSPISVTQYVGCSKMRMLGDQERAVSEHNQAAIDRANRPYSDERP